MKNRLILIISLLACIMPMHNFAAAAAEPKSKTPYSVQGIMRALRNGSMGSVGALSVLNQLRANEKLIASVEAENLDQAREALDEGASLELKVSNCDMLIYAALKNSTKIVQLLLAKGAIIENKGGFTALQVAAMNNNSEMIQSILEKEASPDTKGLGAKTPLYEAMSRKFYPIMNILLEAGANLEMPIVRGYTLKTLSYRDAEAIRLIEKEEQHREDFYAGHGTHYDNYEAFLPILCEACSLDEQNIANIIRDYAQPIRITRLIKMKKDRDSAAASASSDS